MEYGTVTEREIEAIRKIVGRERMSAGESVLDLHSKDESFHERRKPDVVVWPLHTEEISQILKMANEKRIPVTPWGAGTSLEGNPIPVEGGIVLDLQQMNHVLELRKEDLQVHVEAGVIYKELNQHLSRFGLFFPPDPGAAATIGGMVGNNASGVRTVKYGATKDYVLRMMVVLPSGEVIRVGTNAIKSSSGYDLCRLFVGSEGTLGLVTEVTLRLIGLPAEFMAVVAQFSLIREATDTVIQIMRSGLSPAALEFLDAPTVRVVNRFKKLSLEERPTLFVEFHGTSAMGLKEELEIVKEICGEHHSLQFDSGIGREERNRLWEARYGVRESIKVNNPGFHPLVIDTAVPISKYSDMVEWGQKIIEKKGLKGYAFGHAGSGNLHMEIMGIPEERAQWQKVREAEEEIVYFALEYGGTATGEHGIGIGKKRFMRREHGESLLLMKQIKKLLDPNGIMNPGKIFD
ncbi:MAG TPA: FAD-linked oxidase C-terminal domain-containing protein [Thermodesulfobacteriota bacterium]|nr:FAD-linked oxidase C-terminal domain-containing protein [Thermodesulfobacteriota bacterium]